MRSGRSALWAIVLAGLTSGCSKPDPIKETHEGSLAPGDSVVEQDNSYYDEYRFEAAAGDRIVANMVSDEFDSHLWLFTPDKDDQDPQNDDAEKGTLHARIDKRANQTGTYVLWANSHGGGEAGKYTLTIETRRSE